MAMFQIKPTYMWQLATINLGSNTTPARRGLLQIFEELADESKESQQLPMTAMVTGRCGY
jgi:hypothetical protein